MPYSARFSATDNLILHLNSILPSISDPAMVANYAGFLSVSSVTVFELAIKDIFIDFASKKNKVFGSFVYNYFERINGRIKLEELRGNLIKRFGQKYLDRFDRKLKQEENRLMRTSHLSISTDYGNLITCRHGYIHNGTPTLTLTEVVKSYNSGKQIIQCLNYTMRF
jgi:hypothetical protein